MLATQGWPKTLDEAKETPPDGQEESSKNPVHANDKFVAHITVPLEGAKQRWRKFIMNLK